MDDCAVQYEEWSPPEDLSAVVEAVWCVTGIPGERIRVLPDACIDLIALDDRCGKVLVNGPMSVAAVTTLSQHHTAGLRLRPGTVIELGGQRCNARLRDREVVLRSAETYDPREGLFALARGFVADGSVSRHRVVDRVLHEFETGSTLLEEIYRRFGLNERAVQRLFDTFVGLSPKQTAVILRQSAATRMLRGSHTVELAALASAFGFADQAHFARQYRHQVGVPPSAYRHEIESVGFVLADREHQPEDRT